MKKILTVLLTLLSLNIFSQSKFEIDIFNEVNRLRVDPKSYITNIENFKKYKQSIKSSVDWTSDCDSTIIFLQNCNSVDSLKFNQFFYTKLDSFDFKGEHTNIFPKNGSENIQMNSDRISATDVVSYLLIDFNNKSKGHRLNLLNPNFSQTSIREFIYDDNIYYVEVFLP